MTSRARVRARRLSRAMSVGVVVAAMIAVGAPLPAVAEDEALEVRVSPELCLDPCTVRIIARAPPDAENRSLLIELESDTYLRSSWIPLEGDQAPLTHSVDVTGLPAGSYEVRAQLTRSNVERLRRWTRLAVTGPER